MKPTLPEPVRSIRYLTAVLAIALVSLSPVHAAEKLKALIIDGQKSETTL